MNQIVAGELADVQNIDSVKAEAEKPQEYKEALHALAGMNIIMLGIPGVGKTTLAEGLLEQSPDVSYISVGQISRDLPPESPERQELNKLFEAGAPVGVPDLFLHLVEPHIDAAISEGRGFILDGIPKKEEEVAPLLDFMERKGIDIDMVISCEAPTLTAHSRIAERPERVQDGDTAEIFTNRTRVYLDNLDTFKRELSKDGSKPLIVIDTLRNSPEDCVEKLLEVTHGLLENGKEVVTDPAEIFNSKLFEAAKDEGPSRLVGFMGPYFDEQIPEIDHAKLFTEQSQVKKIETVESAFLEADPALAETPAFLRRMTEKYLNTTLASLGHLADSLREEAVLRFGEDYKPEDAAEIFGQQLGLKEFLANLQEGLGEKSIEDLLHEELVVNRKELAHIENILRTRSGDEGLSAAYLMGLQTRLWGQLTSNQIIPAPDFNYRQVSNGIPNSHHSLLPFTNTKRALLANSMSDYVPFVEAVSAGSYKYSSTFGFLHLTGMDERGEAFGVEYPVMMYDQRLQKLNSARLNKILQDIDEFYGNHDLWHNLLPVYADHFILHHPDAPISFGGRLPGYEQFGKLMRKEKEEYEIGVAMAHALTQQERFLADPELRESQVGLLLNALKEVPHLREELKERGTVTEIEDIVDFVASRAAVKALNVFQPNDPIFERVDEVLSEIDFKPMNISASDVALLLWKQRLLDESTVQSILGGEQGSAANVEDDLRRDAEKAAQILRFGIDETRTDRESGAEYIVRALRETGVLDVVADQGEIALQNMQKVRWIAIQGPQREQLKGHMEKVHGKQSYRFGDHEVTDSRELVLMQHDALVHDESHYKYRQGARSENQRLSYEIYSLLFDDNQAVQKDARSLLTYLRQSTESDDAMNPKSVVRVLDGMLDRLVRIDYEMPSDDLNTLEAYASQIDRQFNGTVLGDSLAASLAFAVERYKNLSAREQAYQEYAGTTYGEAKARLLGEQITIT